MRHYKVMYEPKLDRKRSNAHKEANQIKGFIGVLFFVLLVIIILYYIKN